MSMLPTEAERQIAEFTPPDPIFIDVNPQEVERSESEDYTLGGVTTTKPPHHKKYLKIHSDIDDQLIFTILAFNWDTSENEDASIEKTNHNAAIVTGCASDSNNKSVTATNRGVLTLYKLEKSHRPACVRVPNDWRDTLLQDCPALAAADRALLTSAQPTLFNQFREGGIQNDTEAGVRTIKEVLNDLFRTGSKTKLNIMPRTLLQVQETPLRVQAATLQVQPAESEPEWFAKTWYDKWYTTPHEVYTATALLIILRLYQETDDLFAWLVGHSPPEILLELAKINGGGLITISIAKTTIQCLARTIANTRNENREAIDELAESGAHILVSYLRHSKSRPSQDFDDKKAQFAARFEELITTITPGNQGNRILAIKEIGVVFGLLVSGVMKYVIKMFRRFKKQKERTKQILSIATKIIGVAPFAGSASGVLDIALASAVDRYWRDPTQGLPDLIGKLYFQWVRIPLRNEPHRLSERLDVNNIRVMERAERDELEEDFWFVIHANFPGTLFTTTH